MGVVFPGERECIMCDVGAGLFVPWCNDLPSASPGAANPAENVFADPPCMDLLREFGRNLFADPCSLSRARAGEGEGGSP